MNESIKKKINGIGEAGNVVSIILIVLTALGCLCLIAALIVFTLLPKDAVTLGLRIDGDAIVGKSLIGPYLDDIDLSNVDDLDVGISAGGSVSGKVKGTVEKTEEGLRAGFSTDRLNVPSGRLAYGILAASDPMDCSPPGSSIHGIFQVRVLEWVAIAFSEFPE